jgi:hypothetical protein
MTLILTSIVLCLAIWFTIVGVIQVMFQVVNVVLNRDKRTVELGLFILASILWGVFYYLTH